jgi:hypothetical protein
MLDGSELTEADLRDGMDDPLWRLSNLYWITDKDGQRVLFQPNAAQQEYIQGASREDIILKARQLGFTTLMCLIGLDEALFLENHNVAIIAHTRDDANKIFDSKVKYPYDNLPDKIKERRPAINDRAGMLKFEHNSSIGVATSARSGTLQRLHISEFGKICAKYPQKAREIVTGSFPAVGRHPKTIESTAEGQEGYFFDYADKAMRGAGPFRFHFFPWWRDSRYVADPNAVRLTPEHREYFAKLRHEHKVELTPEQMAWWVKEEQLLGGDMKRENPATPEEAFEQAIEGAYFSAQLAHSDKFGHIGRFPYDPSYPVNTFWDLGRNDFNTIWLHQHIRGRHRFVGYYENSGEYIAHYVRWLEDWRKERNAVWGQHHWPHDGKRQDLFLPNGRLGVADDVGLLPAPVIVSRPQNKMDAIDAARAVFATCDFDETECSQGVKRLRHYRKEWDDTREVWRNQPRHDDNSHGADGFMTFACGYQSPQIDDFEPEEPDYGRNDATGY